MNDGLLTPEEAARLLGLSPFTVRRLLREGELPGRKIGKRQWRIRRLDLEAYLSATRHPHPSAFQQDHQPVQPAAEHTRRIARLAAEQRVQPIMDFDQLLDPVWRARHEDGVPEEQEADESADDFLAPIRALRAHSPSRSAF